MNLPSSDIADDEEVTAIMIRVRNDRLILRVDRLIDEYDMVLRPLPDHLDYLPLLIGMVMTGKGTLVSVLHCPAIMDKTSRDYSADMPAATKKAPGAALRVLVVDDSINTREILRDALEGHGYQVVLAEDGADGLRKVKAGVFDAIVTDVEMPHMDGLALTAALRAMEKYRNLPIVILSARQKEEDKRRGLQVGASAYIVKGDADQRSIVDILRKLLG
jgi:two-component system chemotaxis sensor kinase CheA